jgi:hypothetical protein
VNQRYHVVFNKGKTTVRRPWKGKDVEKYSSSGVEAKEGKPEISAMFGDHEVRQFLEPLGDFIIVSIEDKQPAIASQILSEGYTVVDPDDKHQSKWYVAGYFVRDNSVVYVMTPQPMNDSEFFQNRELHIDVRGSGDNCFKVGKYLKRLFSHHDWFNQGQIVSRNEAGNIIEVVLPSGEQITVKYADHGALTDGMHLISSRFVKMHKDLTSKPGQGFQITALGPKFSKGLAIERAGLRYDLVLFNSKELLTGDKFTFAMNTLHGGGAVFTDVQSYVNFRHNQQKHLLKWSTMFMETVVTSVQDTERLRSMLEFYKIKTHMEMDVDGNLSFVEKEEDWTLLNALRHGVDIQQHPALVRRFYNLFTKTVMNCETNMRTPIDKTIGGARYAMVDPSIFDEWGDPTLEGELMGNTVYCDDKVGEVAFHRQPNGHRNEHHIAKSVHSDYLKSMDSGCFMFMSRDMVVDALHTLGGGDQDDRLVYYTDPSVVDHFKQLALDPYPTVEQPEKVVTKRKPNVFEHLRIRTIKYDRIQLLYMFDQMKEQSMSIGYVVNAIMQDTCITDHKEAITQYLATLPSTIKNKKAAQEWMTTFSGNVCRDSASRLEDFIDSVKKTGTSTKGEGKDVRDFNRTYMVVPEFFTHGGKFGGRVPQSRRNESAPVAVRTPIDDEIEEIKDVRKDLEDIVTDNCYKSMKPMPEEILTYPTLDPVSEELADAIKATYFEQRELRKDEDPILVYNETDKLLVKMYGSHPLIMDAMVWLYKKTYERRKPEAPINEDGTLRKFPDGILWGNQMSKLTIKMLEVVGLAGRYVPVTLESKRDRYVSLEVNIKDGVVTQQGTNEVIGSVDPMADGTTLVEKGYAFVKPNTQDVYPYDGPEPRWIVLSVVNGWDSKDHTPSDLATWRAQAHKDVTLVPYVYTNERGEDEHAVHVMLDGQNYGHISRKDAQYVTNTKKGWLAPNPGGPMSMKVICAE